MVVGHFGEPCVQGHSVFIYDRGGRRRVAQVLDVSEVQWSRDRDGISEATVTIQGSACSAQAELLASIEPRRSEMVIYRGTDRVWEGPVNRVGWHAEWVEINAHDVFEYVMNTPLTQAYDNRHRDDENGNPITRPTEATTRVSNILQAELPVWEVLDPPINVLPHVVIHHFPNEAETTAYTMAFEMTAGEHIANLAHYGGIDYTVVGRALHVWDVSRNLGRTRTLTENDFDSEVVITAYGADLATRVIVVGQDGVYGIADNPSDYYGPWTTILTAYNEEGTEAPTQSELESQASRSLSGRSPVPVEVRVPDNSGIILDDTLTIHDLVPGVQVPLLATLNARQLSQTQKIDHIRVTETPEGENIQVILTPATKPDDDTEQ